MILDKSFLRAENIGYEEVFAKDSLLPSQMDASNCMLEYILDPSLGEYSYHMTGRRGQGKTFIALHTMHLAKKLKPSLKVAFLTYDFSGNTDYHPLFSASIEDSDVKVFNDLHNYLGAIRDGKVNKEQAIKNLSKTFNMVKQGKTKSIVITDTKLSSYADEIGDKKLKNILTDSYFLTENEVITGGYPDLAKISRVYGMHVDPRLLWSVHHTRPNVRYLLGLGYIYGDLVMDFEKFTAILKQDYYRYLKSDEREYIDIFFDKPEIKTHEDVMEVIEKLKKTGSPPRKIMVNKVSDKLRNYLIDHMPGKTRYERRDNAWSILPEGYTSADVLTVSSRELLYVPTSMGDFDDMWYISGRVTSERLELAKAGRLKKVELLLDNSAPESLVDTVPTDWKTFQKMKTSHPHRKREYTANRIDEFSYSEEYFLSDLSYGRHRFSIKTLKTDKVRFSFVLGGLINDIVMPHIIQEGIQTR